MSSHRLDVFAAAAIAGIMGHARADNPPEVIAARALEIAKAMCNALEVDDDAEPSSERHPERREDDDAELEAATRPGA